MPHHENKTCGRCNTIFECKAGNITQCQCYAISLTIEERAYIEQKYEDCLCADCLRSLKACAKADHLSKVVDLLLTALEK